MAMPAQPTEWTVDMVRALPDDGNRYEVIDGELFVTPAPSLTHQNAVLELALLIAPYLREHASAARSSPRGRDRVRPAQIRSTRPLRRATRERCAGAGVDRRRSPLLAVEVLSPSTEHTDRGRKRRVYKEKGVPSTGLSIPTRARSNAIEPDDSVEILTESLEWRPDHEVPALVIDLQPASIACTASRSATGKSSRDGISRTRARLTACHTVV
jgi:Uma2 family endonuclease